MSRSFRISEENSKGLIELIEGEESIAQMTYSRLDANNVIIDHTKVNPKVKGTGAGTAILEAMVNWARENKQKVLPLCPFAKAMLEKRSEWHDVIRK
tara:strand:- start:70 stop:360 length:291 start_codon:yes stop_codon:yes gene_type:complete